MSDTKISALATAASLANADLFAIIDDVATTPVSRSLRADALKTYVEDFGEVPPYHAQTTAETSAGVTPTDYSYEPGNVLRYGANTTPGTTDMSTALTNAFSSYDTVDVPEDILISSDFTVGANQTLRGGGMRSVTITLSGVGTTLFIEDRSVIHDITISGGDTNTKVVATAPTAARWRLSNVQISNGVSGLVLENTWIGMIDNCYLSGNTNGLHLSNSLGVDNPVNAITVIGGEIQSNTIGVLVDDSGNGPYGINNLNFFGATIEGNSTGGVLIDSGVGVDTLNMIGCYFEANNDYIYKQTSGCGCVKFDSCFLDLDDAATDRGIWVTGGTTECFTVMNCEFDDGGGGLATEAVDFESGAIIRDTVFIANRYEAAHTVTNDMSAGYNITSVADRKLGTKLPGVDAISGGTDPLSEQWMGKVNSDGSSTLTVTLGATEADATYQVLIFGMDWDTTWWITNKNTTSFRINWGTADPSSPTEIYYQIYRR